MPPSYTGRLWKAQHVGADILQHLLVSQKASRIIFKLPVEELGLSSRIWLVVSTVSSKYFRTLQNMETEIMKQGKRKFWCKCHPRWTVLFRNSHQIDWSLDLLLHAHNLPVVFVASMGNNESCCISSIPLTKPRLGLDEPCQKNY